MVKEKYTLPPDARLSNGYGLEHGATDIADAAIGRLEASQAKRADIRSRRAKVAKIAAGTVAGVTMLANPHGTAEFIQGAKDKAAETVSAARDRVNEGFFGPQGNDQAHADDLHPNHSKAKVTVSGPASPQASN